MESNKRNLGIGLAVIGALAGLSQCPGKDKVTETIVQPAPTTTNIPNTEFEKALERFFNGFNEEGPAVDMSQYLGSEGELKPDFSPASAVTNCIKANSKNFGPSNAAGTNFIFPERIESDPEGTFPIKILDDGNRWMRHLQNNQVSITIVSGSGRQSYEFDLNDPTETAVQVQTACQDGLEELKMSHSPEDFCTDEGSSSTTLEQSSEGITRNISLKEIICNATQARWTSYAEMGQNFHTAEQLLEANLATLGFDSITRSGDFLKVENGAETVLIKPVIYDDPGFTNSVHTGYLVIHEGENDVTNQITFSNQDAALDYVIDPKSFEAEQGWSLNY